MRAVVQAGGKGTRLAEFYPDLPKPMIPICGVPLLKRQIDSLRAQGFDDITLIVGYKSDIIREYFGDSVRYITEESPLGTGGALSLLPKEDTLVLFGDVYGEVDFERFIRFHRDKNADITLFAHPNAHPHDSDIILTDADGKVTGWVSKKDDRRGDRRNLVNAGLYVFSANAWPAGEPVRRDLEHDRIVPRIKDAKIYAYRSTEYVKDMGTPERLRQVESDLTKGIPSARSLKNKQKTIFLDRDGTINVADGFVTKPDRIRIIDGAAEAVRRINGSAYLAVCVTNQPVVARGDVTFEELDRIHARLDTLLGEQGAYLDDLLFCPHHTDKGFDGEIPELKFDCDCRKPKPGLLLRAADRYNIDLSESYMLGDSLRDIGAGRAAGCKSVLIDANHTLSAAVSEILGD